MSGNPNLLGDAEVRLAAEAVSPGLSDGLIIYNIHRLMLNATDFCRQFQPLSQYLARSSLLDPRTREIAILRTLWNAGCAYEAAHHFRIGQESGIPVEDLERVAAGAGATGWSTRDRAVLRAVDTLDAKGRLEVSDLAEIAAHLSVAEQIELVMTNGLYRAVAATVLSFAVPLDNDLPPFPPFATTM